MAGLNKRKRHLKASREKAAGVRKQQKIARHADAELEKRTDEIECLLTSDSEWRIPQEILDCIDEETCTDDVFCIREPPKGHSLFGWDSDCESRQFSDREDEGEDETDVEWSDNDLSDAEAYSTPKELAEDIFELQSSEINDIDSEEEADTHASDTMMQASRAQGFSTARIRYQRDYSAPSDRTMRRQRATARQKAAEVEEERAHPTHRPLTEWLIPAPHGQGFQNVLSQQRSTPMPTSLLSVEQQQRQDAYEDLKHKLKSKNQKRPLDGQNRVRHEAVFRFMAYQRRKSLGETRRQCALNTAKAFDRGGYFARKLVQWERMWISSRTIEEGKQGCFSKVASWFEDEGVQNAIREHISETGEKLNAYSLAKLVGEYLHSERASEAVQQYLSDSETPGDGAQPRKRGPAQFRARTARRWLKKLGMIYGKVAKGVYVDGHERDDVVFYRQHVFIPKWDSFRDQLATFDENGVMHPPPNLPAGHKPLVLVTHDESTFNANDGKRRIWMTKGKQPLRPKSRGKGIMVSAFLTPGGILKVPGNVSDAFLLQDPGWPQNIDGTPIREAVELLEYGKNNYWTGDKMCDQAVNAAARIFSVAFPGCQALWAFDNASNHCSFKKDALRAKDMNKGPGGKQPLMRDGFDHNNQIPQTMTFAANHPEPDLRGKAKGVFQVLRERRLWWPGKRRADGREFLLECPKQATNEHAPATGRARSSCQPDMEGGCCGKTLLSLQRDFQEQKGRLEEEMLALNHEVIFYPKFHCELNFIERFWCKAKYYARENCAYSIEGLREVVPEALKSVSIASINRYYGHCMRILDAYRDPEVAYGTESFKKAIYKSHRKVADPSRY